MQKYFASVGAYSITQVGSARSFLIPSRLPRNEHVVIKVEEFETRVLQTALSGEFLP
jgi:hypothetical protein